MKVRLRIVKGAGEGKTFVFTKVPVRIGRAADNDLVLNDDGVSRLQCELVIEPSGLMLRDLTSANGTKVNDVIATETELKTGDSIGMGPVVFEVLEIDLDAKADSVRPVAMGDGDPGTRPSAPPRKPPADVHGVSRRILALAGVTGLVLAVGAVYWIVTHAKPDQSATIFPIDARARSTSYGLGNVDVLASDRVTFSFDSQGGRVTIGYAASSVERPDQVEIVVNGERVGYAPQTASGWTTGSSVIVPRQLLNAGRNIVMFDNLDIPARNGRADDRWGIGQLTVAETALPEPNPAKAKQYFDLGTAAFDSRSAEPQNLARALAYFEEAELFTAGEADPSDLAVSIDKELIKVRAELQTTFEAHIFSAEQAVRFGDTERARDALRDVLRYFPDTNDPRHQAAKARLAELGIANAP